METLNRKLKEIKEKLSETLPDVILFPLFFTAKFGGSIVYWGLHLILLLLAILLMYYASTFEDSFWRHLLIEGGAALLLFLAVEWGWARSKNQIFLGFLTSLSIGLIVLAYLCKFSHNREYWETLFLILGMTVAVFLFLEIVTKRILHQLEEIAREHRKQTLTLLGDMDFNFKITEEDIRPDLEHWDRANLDK